MSNYWANPTVLMFFYNFSNFSSNQTFILLMITIWFKGYLMIELLQLLPYLLLFYITIKIPLFDLKLITIANL